MEALCCAKANQLQTTEFRDQNCSVHLTMMGFRPHVLPNILLQVQVGNLSYMSAEMILSVVFIFQHDVKIAYFIGKAQYYVTC